MPRKDAPEFSYDEKTKLYRKQIKNHEGRWVPVYGKTKQELRQKVKLRKEEFASLASTLESPYCYQYAKVWFDSWSPGKSYKEIEAIRGALNNHVLPHIGNLHISEVTEDDLDAMMSDLVDKSKSLNSKVCRATKNMFKLARRSGIISTDPTADLTPGGKKTKEKEALTEEQQKTLLDAVEGTSIYTFVLLVLHSGLRREEALALRWDCVHLEDKHPYIAVRWALRWENNQPIVSDILKSDAAGRDIPIDPKLVDHLKKEKEKSTGIYVIGGSKPLTTTAFRRRWETIEARSVGSKVVIGEDGKETVIEKKLGDKVRNHPIYITIDFKVTPHQLRHTYITRLILAGVNIKIVQYLAGHASVQMTLNIYSHVMGKRPADTSGPVLSAFAPQKDSTDEAQNPPSKPQQNLA